MARYADCSTCGNGGVAKSDCCRSAFMKTGDCTQHWRNIAMWKGVDSQCNHHVIPGRPTPPNSLALHLGQSDPSSNLLGLIHAPRTLTQRHLANHHTRPKTYPALWLSAKPRLSVVVPLHFSTIARKYGRRRHSACIELPSHAIPPPRRARSTYEPSQ